jgi:hypothetical protein
MDVAEFRTSYKLSERIGRSALITRANTGTHPTNHEDLIDIRQGHRILPHLSLAEEKIGTG